MTYPPKKWANGDSSKQAIEREKTYQLYQRPAPASSHVVGELAGKFESFENACRHKNTIHYFWSSPLCPANLFGV